MHDCGVAALLEQVLGKPPEWTWTIIQEVELEDWGWGSVPVADRRRMPSPDPERRNR